MVYLENTLKKKKTMNLYYIIHEYYPLDISGIPRPSENSSE